MDNTATGKRPRFTPLALVAEDDWSLAESVVECLQLEGFTASTCSTIAEVRQQLALGTMSLLILDLNLEDGFSGDLLKDLAKNPEAPPTLLFSGSVSAKTIADRFHLELLKKPCTLDQLVAAVERTVTTSRRPTAAAG